MADCDSYIYAKHLKSWDNLYYSKQKEWAVIFNENGDIMTSYKIEADLKSFELLHQEIGIKTEKGVVNEKIKKIFKKLRDRYTKLGE